MAQTIQAIYENGVFKPLEPINIKEHTMVKLTLDVDEERRKKIEEILELASQCFENLSEEEISIIESARLDKTLIFPNRVDLE